MGQRDRILGHPVDAVDWDAAVSAIVKRALDPIPGAYVCLSNAHTTLLSRESETFRAAADGSYLSLPDGLPLAIILKRRGHARVEKVAGPDLFPGVVAAGRGVGLRHFLYGWTPRLAERVAQELLARAPGAEIVGVHAPPFAADPSDSAGSLAPAWVDIGGPVTAVDWQLGQLREALKESRPHILWVGLGAPVQEEWMAMLAGSLQVPVMIGVGRAFNNLADTAPRAPQFIRAMGLEWLFILSTEPRRLWRRYVFGIPKFLFLLVRAGWLARAKALQRSSR